MLTYKGLNVNFNRPYIWRKRDNSLKKKSLRSYASLLAEENAFKDFRQKARDEIVNIIDSNVLTSDSKNVMSMRLAEIFERFGKSLVFDTGIDPVFLLKHTNKITLNKKLQPWCSQLNMNVPYITEHGYGIVGLLNKFKDVPAFVVAAGPSLKNNINELRRVGNKGVIIAVDTSFRPLLNAGIEPHIVMAHDANHNGAKFFLPDNYFPETSLNDLEGVGLQLTLQTLRNDKPNILKKWNYKTIAAFVDYVSPLTIESFCGDMVMFYSVFDPSLPVYQTMAHATNWHKNPDGTYRQHDKGAVLGGSSVGHTALYLANALGCNPISFLGLDLSYPGGKTYVDGASNPKDISKIQLVDVEDISDRPVKTNISMFSYREVLEKMLPQLIMQSNIQVYNCTEHPDGSPAGILECGAEPKQVKWVIDTFCKQELPIVENMRDLVIKDRDGGENK